MTTALLGASRPEPGEYDPYYGGYIARVPAGDVGSLLDTQIRDTGAILRAVPPANATYRYAEGKWSIAEVVGHVIDCERIFSYRLLRIARADETPIEGFDENAYVPAAEFDGRGLADLITEFEAVRRATVALVRGLPTAAWTRLGTANGKPISVRALVYIIAGHERHHLGTLRERYGLGG
ncbi:MAG: DinB family protein [Gemmatimonadales bacterium]